MTSAVRELPVELARLAAEWSGLQRAIVDTDDRHQLAVVAAREDLVGALEIGIAERALHHGHAGIAQQLDGAVTRNAGEERAVRRRRINHAILGEEDVRRRKLRDVSEH